MSKTISRGSRAVGSTLPSASEEARLRNAAPPAPERHGPLQWKQSALQAMRRGEGGQAWLWADTLCRHLGGLPLADAYLLRSAAAAMRGDLAGAEADLQSAALVAPEAPSLNRALLNAPSGATRVAAARRLLRAETADDRNCGIAALAREKIDCVGRFVISDGRLTGRVLWNGKPSLTVLLRTDVSGTAVALRGSADDTASGFAHVATLSVALPKDVRIVVPAIPKINAVFEPASLLLPPRRAVSTAEAAQATRRRLLIAIPVFKDRAATAACLDSVLSALPSRPPCRVVVVDDASPDAALAGDLRNLEDAGRITLMRNAINLGFAGSVNRALELRTKTEDVLLLNSDTIVPPGAIAALVAHLDRDPEIGTVTPLSNNGEDTSFPHRFRANPLPDAGDVAVLQAIAERVNGGVAVDMPNGVGFCLAIRGELFERLGPLSNLFERGYYEDVEFCLCAAEAGYRNVCAADVFVGHQGSRSFGTDKRALVVRNLRRLVDRHPDYIAASNAFQNADPLKSPVARIEEEFLRDQSGVHVLLVPQDTPPVLTDVLASLLSHRHGRVVVLRPRGRGKDTTLELTAPDGAMPQNIMWRCAPGGDLATEIATKLSDLSIRSATILDHDQVPRAARDALAERVADVDVLPVHACWDTAAHTAALDLADAPGVPRPRFAPRRGSLVVVGITWRADDLALLRALGEAFSGPHHEPTIIVAAAREGNHTLAPNIHVSGSVAGDDLPGWLTQIGAQGVLFADRKWGQADPRAVSWARAGLAVARFVHGVEAVRHAGDGMVLPMRMPAAQAAQAIASWLITKQPAVLSDAS